MNTPRLPVNLKMSGLIDTIRRIGKTYHTRYVDPEVFKSALRD